MKKIIALVLVLALAVSLLAACGQENTIGEANAAASQDDGKLRIVTTIFPEYDWIREILGDQADRADLTMRPLPLRRRRVRRVGGRRPERIRQPQPEGHQLDGCAQ